jgi:hypothetical protein
VAHSVSEALDTDLDSYLDRELFVGTREQPVVLQAEPEASASGSMRALLELAEAEAEWMETLPPPAAPVEQKREPAEPPMVIPEWMRVEPGSEVSAVETAAHVLHESAVAGMPWGSAAGTDVSGMPMTPWSVPTSEEPREAERAHTFANNLLPAIPTPPPVAAMAVAPVPPAWAQPAAVPVAPAAPAWAHPAAVPPVPPAWAQSSAPVPPAWAQPAAVPQVQPSWGQSAAPVQPGWTQPAAMPVSPVQPGWAPPAVPMAPYAPQPWGAAPVEERRIAGMRPGAFLGAAAVGALAAGLLVVAGLHVRDRMSGAQASGTVQLAEGTASLTGGGTGAHVSSAGAETVSALPAMAGATGTLTPRAESAAAAGATPPGVVSPRPGVAGTQSSGIVSAQSGIAGTQPPGTEGTFIPGALAAMPPGAEGRFIPWGLGTQPAGAEGTFIPGPLAAMPPGTEGTFIPGLLAATPPGTEGMFVPARPLAATPPGAEGTFVPAGPLAAMPPGAVSTQPGTPGIQPGITGTPAPAGAASGTEPGANPGMQQAAASVSDTVLSTAQNDVHGAANNLRAPAATDSTVLTRAKVPTEPTREPLARKAAPRARVIPASTVTEDTSVHEEEETLEASTGEAAFDGAEASTAPGPKSTQAAVSSTQARPPGKYADLDEDFARELGFTEDAETKKQSPQSTRTVYIPPAPDAKEHLTPDDVKQVVMTNQPAITACLRQHAQGTPVEKGGRFLVKWSILPAGDTAQVSMDTDTLRATPLARCIEDVVRRWKFPAHRVRMQEPIRFPFVF